ncbi:MAG: hypothetical protein FWG89_08670 [Treponema sp.]|nr:hypothetical protein [Treponema sp.]
MKNITKFFGLIALAAVIGLSMTACPMDEGGGNGSGSGSNSLEAKWYMTQEAADIGGNDWIFEITNEGKFVLKDDHDTDVFSYTAAGGVITISLSEQGQSMTMGTVDYLLSGTELTLSNGTQELQIMVSIMFYKKKPPSPSDHAPLSFMHGSWYNIDDGISFSLSLPGSVAIPQGASETLTMRLELITSTEIRIDRMGTAGVGLPYQSYEQWVVANRSDISGAGVSLLNLANDGSNNYSTGPIWIYHRLDEMRDNRGGRLDEGVVQNDWDVLSFINASSPINANIDTSILLLDGTLNFYEEGANTLICTMRFFFIRDWDRAKDAIVIYDFKLHVPTSYDIPQEGVYERSM